MSVMGLSYGMRLVEARLAGCSGGSFDWLDP